MAFNQKLHDAVTALEKEAVSALQEVIRIDSTTGKEQEAQAYMEKLMASIGMDVDKWCPTDEELRPMKQYPGSGASSQKLGDRPNVVGVLKGSGGGRSLILNGHIDTVPVNSPEVWICPPYSGEIIDGKMYGRGTSDMKSGLLGAAIACMAIKKAGIKLKGDLILESVICEERGGCGTLACMQRGYDKADGAIIMEPTTARVCTAETGTMLMRITIDGVPAHGSAPYAGVSAIEKWSYVLEKINEWDRARHEASGDQKDPRFKAYKMVAPVCFGMVHAGSWTAMLPNKLEAEGRLGFMTNQTVESIRKEFEQLLLDISAGDEWLRDHPARVEWMPMSWDAFNIKGSHSLPDTLQASCKDLGLDDELTAIPYGTDIKYFLEANIPTILYGPGTITKAHYDNEYVIVKNYLNEIAALAEFIVRWCGIDE